MRLAFATVATALLLTGCGGSSDDRSDKPASATTTPAPAKNVEYDTVVELRDAYIEAGGSCDDWRQTDRVQSALESGECDDSTVLSIYVDRDEAMAAADVLADIASLGDEPLPVLVGPNWIINNDEDADGLVPLKQKIGGTVENAY